MYCTGGTKWYQLPSVQMMSVKHHCFLQLFKDFLKSMSFFDTCFFPSFSFFRNQLATFTIDEVEIVLPAFRQRWHFFPNFLAQQLMT
jgi:hypothetical protein